MLALDLDGTTFGKGKELPLDNKARLLKAREAGVKICFVTGRKDPTPLTDLFSMGDYLILSNGGTLLRLPGCEKIYSKMVDRKDMLRLIDFCNEHQIVLHMFTSDYWGVNYKTEHVRRMMQWYGRETTIYHSAQELPFDSIDGFIISGDYDTARRFIEEEKLNLVCTTSSPVMMDVMPGGVDKWKAVLHVAGIEGVSREEILAMGNYFNDEGMIVGAGIGVAVQNAPDEVKAAADYVTVRTNEEGAVAEAIDRFVLGRGQDAQI